MTKTARILSLLFVPALAITVGAAPWRGDRDEIPLDEAEVFIEFNSTDEDLGIQFFWDGEAWDRMKVEASDGRTVLRVSAARSLALQGLTEGFFESDEPSVDELSLEEFLARFPAGTYEFEGRTLEGDELEGETEFTHVIPAAPANLFPAAGAVVDSTQPLVASFDAVSADLDGGPLTPELYELVVETEGDILRVFSIILAGDTVHPSATVPPELLDPGTEYKLEVIVQEESGNRTISEIEFSTL
jgi:hypothetical protein